MFPTRFFALNYFARRYFPRQGVRGARSGKRRLGEYLPPAIPQTRVAANRQPYPVGRLQRPRTPTPITTAPEAPPPVLVAFGGYAKATGWGYARCHAVVLCGGEAGGAGVGNAQAVMRQQCHGVGVAACGGLGIWQERPNVERLEAEEELDLLGLR